MFHSSRTTLKELKKRYLNILKKCLLANLMAFSFCLPSMAEESLTPTFLNQLMQDGSILMTQNETVTLMNDLVITNSTPLETTKLDTSSKILTFQGVGSIDFKDIQILLENQGGSIEFSAGALGIRTVSFENTGGVNFLNNSIVGVSDGGTMKIYGAGYGIGYKPVTILSMAKFENNRLQVDMKNGVQAHAAGAAISTTANLSSFLDSVSFKQNTITMSLESNASRAYGGVINAGYNGDFVFSKNVVFEENGIVVEATKGTSYAYGGVISSAEQVEIAYGTSKDDIVEFKNNFVKNTNIGGDALGYGGALQNGSHIFNGTVNFEKNIVEVKGNLLGYLNAYGGAIYSSGSSIFNSDVTFMKNSVAAENDKGWIDASGGATFAGTNTFLENAYFIENSAYVHSKQSGGYARAGAIYGGTHNFEKNSYFIGNKAEILSVGSYLRSYGGATYGSTITLDGLAYFIGNETISNSDFGNIDSKGGSIYSSKMTFNNKSIFVDNKATVKSNTGLVTAQGGAIYNDKPIEFNGKAIFMNNTSIGSSLGEIIVEGGAIYNAAAGVVNLNSDFDFSGNKIIINGVAKANDIYTEGKINVTGDEKTIGILSGGVSGRQIIAETSSTIPQINKSGAGLLVLGDQSENHEYEGAFTQTAGTTIANSERFFSHEKAVNTINGGELKTHGAEIAYKATLGETGTLTHLGSSADTPTEIKGITFDGTGLNLTLGSYTKAEQEKEIALVGDRFVEYVDENGETIRYQSADKLFTINALENDQKAKFVLKENLSGMDGNTLTIDNAELLVKKGLKVAGTVVAKDMRLMADGTSSFSELEVAEKGTLDIQNQMVMTDTLLFNEGGLLKVGVNSLSDYGKMITSEIKNADQGQLTLNLIGAPEEGVYKVFESDTDLKLVTTNDFFDIRDLENGSYKIDRKNSDELAQKFGLSEEETRAVSAVIGGNSEHNAFQKVQKELMETLKSNNKGKAKKALKAVGTSEQSSAQAVASNHVGAVGKVVGGEMKGGSMKGHSGGEENPRAKVFIKGLYDKTKSTMGDGFKARSQGAVLGVQSEVTDALTLGVGYATSQTTAKEDLRRTEVDTNTGFISAHYQPNAWWMSGLATYSRGQYDEQKQVLSSVGMANYDVDSWGLQVMTGYDIKLENTVITPEVGLRYLAVKQEGYTDTLGTTVEATSSDY